jgi:DNA-directed RNA polymerase specialized sigma24 family protein
MKGELSRNPSAIETTPTETFVTMAHVERLPDPYQTAVRLHCLEKYSYVDIARYLNVSEGTVKCHVGCGIKLLQEQPELDISTSYDDIVKQLETLADLEVWVQVLRDPYQRAVRLHCVEKRSFAEVARHLQLPEGTVKSHVSRGMKMLRTLSQQEEDVHFILITQQRACSN